MTHQHPANQARHDDLPLGDRVADRLAAVVGSWRFIIWQNVIVAAWIAFNVLVVFVLRWDPYPFVLLNLVFSWQASNTGPVLQLSQNRQAEHDRARAEHDYAVNEESLALNRAIGAHLGLAVPAPAAADQVGVAAPADIEGAIS